MNRDEIIELFENLREQLQDDLMTYFDGMPNKVTTEMCDIVVKDVNKYITVTKMKHKDTK